MFDEILVDREIGQEKVRRFDRQREGDLAALNLAFDEFFDLVLPIEESPGRLKNEVQIAAVECAHFNGDRRSVNYFFGFAETCHTGDHKYFRFVRK